jgi:hypothetical protein
MVLEPVLFGYVWAGGEYTLVQLLPKNATCTP